MLYTEEEYEYNDFAPQEENNINQRGNNETDEFTNLFIGFLSGKIFL